MWIRASSSKPRLHERIFVEDTQQIRIFGASPKKFFFSSKKLDSHGPNFTFFLGGNISSWNAARRLYQAWSEHTDEGGVGDGGWAFNYTWSFFWGDFGGFWAFVLWNIFLGTDLPKKWCECMWMKGYTSSVLKFFKTLPNGVLRQSF